MFVAYVSTEYAWITSPATRMRLRTSQWTVRRACATVSAETDKWRLHRGTQVGFTHHEVDGSGLTLVGKNEIEHSIQRILFLLHGNFRNALALQRLQLSINHCADQNSFRTTASKINVFPVLLILGYLFLQTLPRRGIAQTAEHLFGAAFECPRRQTRSKRGAAGDVRINIRGDVHAIIARLLDAREHVGHAPPVLFVRSFQVPNLNWYLSL